MRRYLPEGEYDSAQGALIYGIDQLGSVREVIAGPTSATTRAVANEVTKATAAL
jgi:hypothetical protein